MSAGRNNVRKRGNSWTYYLYVTDGTGARRQVSKGGFRTRKEAEAARIKALSTLQNGTWVRPERVTVREFRNLSIGDCRVSRRIGWLAC